MGVMVARHSYTVFDTVRFRDRLPMHGMVGTPRLGVVRLVQASALARSGRSCRGMVGARQGSLDVWRSPVAQALHTGEVIGSNPVTSTTASLGYGKACAGHPKAEVWFGLAGFGKGNMGVGQDGKALA